MQIEKALGEDSDGDNARGQNRPHEQSVLLDVINHGGYLLSSFALAGQAARSSATKRYEERSLTKGKRGQSGQLIYIDGWHGRWLKVGKSGLEWNTSPPANAYVRPTLLRRRVSSLH